MREIRASHITDTVARLCVEANRQLPQDVRSRICAAYADELWPIAKEVLGRILENADIAAERLQPICQDTGMACVFVELGQDAVIYRADTGLAAFFTVVAAAVQLVLLFCLWQGLLDMQRDAGITPPAAPAAGALLLWYILLYVAAALFASLSLLLGAYLVWYFYLVVRLKKLSKSMAAQGCAIKPVKERFSNPKLVGSLLAVCNTLANGPSKTARDKAVMSALQASATKWMPGLFLSSDTVEEIKKNSQVVVTDVKPITDIPSGDGDGDTPTADKWANAIDGMIYENVNGTTFKGYVLLIKDPARVTVGVSSNDFAHATAGMRIFELADKYNAVAAINAGEFRDDGGVGTGYAPMGLTYSEGNCVWNDGLSRTFMGFDKNNRLYVAEGTTYAQAEELGMRDAVSFQTGNVLITNDGTNVTYYYADSNTGVAQRTAIGQCADGTVIFLVTDGRTASSMGATRNEIIDTLISYGAVTAGMLDGGSSSMLYYRDYFTKYNIDQSQLDEYQKMGLVNKYKAFTNPRRIPTYFIVKP